MEFAGYWHGKFKNERNLYKFSISEIIIAMKSIYQDDLQKGPGYGFLIFSEAIFPDSPWNISILRASDKKYFSGRADIPWTGEKTSVPLAGRVQDDGALLLEVGPVLVDELDPQEQYALVLSGDGESQKSRLKISGITYSPSGKLGIIPNTNTQTIQPAPAPPSAPIQPQAPQAPPIPPQQPTLIQQTASEPLDLPSPAPKNRHIWRWGLLALLALLCIAWYFFDPRFKETASAPETTKEQPAKETASSADAQVNQFFKKDKITPAEALALARQLPDKTVADQDAIYRLYYFAAENGDKNASFYYAQTLDPVMPKWGSIEKSAPDAWHMYEKAASQQAEQAQQKLLEWLEREAAGGHAQAREWLRQIK